jgi:hypothetical protein
VAFNTAIERLERHGAIPRDTPRIKFLEVCVYYMSNVEIKKEFGYLVEKQLEGTWKKWNSNNGYVAGRKAELEAEEEESEPTMAAPTGPLARVEECEEVDGFSDDEVQEEMEPVARWPTSRETSQCHIDTESVPQTFSHFTYHHSKHKLLVCDLQGVFDDRQNPPAFELTDPAIHWRSQQHRHGHKYGATDKGEVGMEKFFETHECTDLCRALQLETPKRKRGRSQAAFPMPAVPLGIPRPPRTNRGSTRSTFGRPSSPWED